MFYELTQRRALLSQIKVGLQGRAWDRAHEIKDISSDALTDPRANPDDKLELLINNVCRAVLAVLPSEEKREFKEYFRGPGRFAGTPSDDYITERKRVLESCTDVNNKSKISEDVQVFLLLVPPSFSCVVFWLSFF